MTLPKPPNRNGGFYPSIWEAVILLAIALVCLLWLVSCVTVERGAVELFPERPETASVERSTSETPNGITNNENAPERPKTPWWDDSELWAIMASTIGIIGHRIYSQRKGAYTKH